jgi:hypothetical protein
VQQTRTANHPAGRPAPPSASPTDDLDERVAAALREQPPSGDVVSLIAEAKSAARRADEAAAAARAVAMDPTLSRTEVADARARMEDALFRRDRAKAAIIHLGDRLREIERIEEQSRRRGIAIRDALNVHGQLESLRFKRVKNKIKYLHGTRSWPCRRDSSHAAKSPTVEPATVRSSGSSSPPTQSIEA